MILNLYNHQKQGLEDTKNFKKVAYFWDMGTGKTFVGSEKMKIFNNNTNLLICQMSKIKDWIDHFKKYYPMYQVLNLRNKLELESFIKHCKTTKMVGVINYDLVFRRKELKLLKNFTLILDESSVIQNEKTSRATAILNFNFSNIILLSGTPVSGKYEKLWSQSQLLGWKISKKLFLKHYTITEKFELPDGTYVNKIIGYKNIERLKRKLREYGASFLKTEEVMNLPEKTFIDVIIERSKEYKKFNKSKIIEFEGEELIGDNPLKSLLYKRLLLGISNEKLNALKDLIDCTSNRIIIFYNFKKEFEEIKKIIKDRPISVVNGDLKDLSAYENYNNSITLVNFQAGAKGLNLQKANILIFYSPTLSVEDYMQSKKRIHRIGQDKPCFYYKIIAENTIEEDIYNSLEKGEDFTDYLFKEEK